MADIAEVIGKAQVEQRIEAAIEVFLKWENNFKQT
jgi:hypothetical protein